MEEYTVSTERENGKALMKQSILDTITIFIKGLFMGSADIIPGVSGGTIALITGIYERFIFALKSINISFLYYLILSIKDKNNFRKAKKHFTRIDFVFLLPLACGILVAFLTLANVLSFLLETIPAQTFGFFFGLILASAGYVYYSHKQLFQLSSILFIAFGIVLGFLVVGLESIQLDHSYPMIFASGIISLCAMMLPGLSGAFILLVLGQYEFLLSVLRDLTHLEFGMIGYVIAYGLGGFVGLIGFSRVLGFLFSRYKPATIAFITGLMIGALRKPGMEMIKETENIGFTAFAVVIGMVLVLLFSVYELRKKQIIA